MPENFEFDRIVGVVNPAASRFKQVIGQLDSIANAFPELPYYEIRTDKDFVDTATHLSEIGQKNDLVVVVGGDGTKGTTAKEICKTGGILLPLPGGSGNDLDTGLFGRENRLSPVEIIQKGTVINIHPISLAVNGVHNMAINYCGIGSTGRGSRTMNSDWFREKLPFREIDAVRDKYEKIVIPTVAFLTPPFVVTENNKNRLITEFSVINGPSIAKRGRIPVRLEQEEAFVTECATPTGLLPWAIKSVRGTLEGEYLKRGEFRTLHIRHTVLGRAIVGHVDAQTFDISEGSAIVIGISDESFRAISTSGAYTPR